MEMKNMDRDELDQANIDMMRDFGVQTLDGRIPNDEHFVQGIIQREDD